MQKVNIITRKDDPNKFGVVNYSVCQIYPLSLPFAFDPLNWEDISYFDDWHQYTLTPMILLSGEEVDNIYAEFETALDDITDSDFPYYAAHHWKEKVYKLRDELKGKEGER